MLGAQPVASPVARSNSLTQAKLARLISIIGSQSAVAGLLGVHRSRVTRWLAGDEPDPHNRAKLEGLEFVVSRLLDRMPLATARKWLKGTNAHLGNRRPVDLVVDNRIAEVLAAIEQAAVDSYA